MKNISIYFHDPAFEDYPFDEPGYRKAYHRLASALERGRARVSIVRGQRNYVGGNTFKRGWRFRAGRFRAVDEPVHADVIFNRGFLRADREAVMLNKTELEALCRDKSKTYEAFPDLCPLTRKVHSAEEARAALALIPSERAVIKPLRGLGGEGVVIKSKASLEAHLQDFPLLVQEFVDTSGGIPGIAEGTHDLRVVMVNGRPSAAFVREPPAGSLVSNVALGGSIRDVPLATLPSELLAIMRRIDRRVEAVGDRLYAADFGLSERGEWRLFEINAEPGLPVEDTGEGEGGERLFGDIVALLLAA